MDFLTLTWGEQYHIDRGWSYIEFQDGTTERFAGTRNEAVNKCMKMGFTAPQNEIAKFLTRRITQLVMFRKYNKKKRTNPKNPNSGK